MSKWAVFDVDGTLLPHTSMEKMFIIHAYKAGILPKRNFFFYFFSILQGAFQKNFTGSIKSNKTYLRNLPVNRIQRWSHQFLENCIWNRISLKGIVKLDQLRSMNFKVLIMSGSPDFLTHTLGKKLYHNYIITTNLEKRTNIYTGKVKGIHPYGVKKTQLLLSLQEKLQISFENSCVFANHHQDADHMKLFGQATAVNPTKKLYRIALQNRWLVEWWNN